MYTPESNRPCPLDGANRAWLRKHENSLIQICETGEVWRWNKELRVFEVQYGGTGGWLLPEGPLPCPLDKYVRQWMVDHPYRELRDPVSGDRWRWNPHFCLFEVQYSGLGQWHVGQPYRPHQTSHATAYVRPGPALVPVCGDW